MNIRTIAAVTVAGAIVGKAAMDCVQTSRIERKKREEIQLNLEKNLDAIRLSSEIVHRKIQAGEYDRGFPMQDILSDLKFYQMTARFED